MSERTIPARDGDQTQTISPSMLMLVATMINLKRCSKCKIPLLPGINERHGQGTRTEVNWCDQCWSAFWTEEHRKEKQSNPLAEFAMRREYVMEEKEL